MAHPPYATLAEATECLIDASRIAFGGWDEIVAQKAAMGQHEHRVQGYIHGVAFGTTDGPFTAASEEEQAAFGAKLEEFATAMQAARPNEIPMAAVQEATGGNFAGTKHGERKVDF